MFTIADYEKHNSKHPLGSLGTRIQRAQGPKAQGSIGAHGSIGADGSIGPMGP